MSLPSTWAQTMSMASHWVGLTLPGMIELTRLVGGQDQLAEPGPRPGGRATGCRWRSSSAARRARAARRRRPPPRPTPPSAANLFGAVTNGYPVDSAIRAATSAPNPGGAFSPVPTAVPPAASSYRSAQARSRPASAWVELPGVAGPLLPDGERHRVLQVGPADLHDVPPLRRPSSSMASRSAATRGHHRFRDRPHGGDVHGGRERVVGGLPHVHVVVGVHRRLATR